MTFVLKGISFEEVFLKYNIIPQKKKVHKPPRREVVDEMIETNRRAGRKEARDIPLNQLLHEDDKIPSFSIFSDPSDNPIKIWTWAFDLSSGKEIPSYTNKFCLWDKHSFTSHVWSLPLVYRREQDMEYFGCEGVFCSPECRYAYLMDKLKSVCNHTTYRFCPTLITLYDLRVFGEITECHEAPDWMLLKPFGGHLTITEFRRLKNRLIYQKLINHNSLISLHHSAFYEERREG